jgi:NAD(P)-dependent dehydrogenase (short-subunit alcohol dehydrogenase family)
MQGAIADMVRRGAGGSIVNILSMNAHCGSPDLAVYSATKGALGTLTKNAANAHARDRIRVNGLNLGWVATPAERHLHAVVLGKGDAWLDEMARARPFGRFLTATEAAALCIFLLGDQCGVMTGAVVDQDQWVAGAPAL